MPRLKTDKGTTTAEFNGEQRDSVYKAAIRVSEVQKEYAAADFDLKKENEDLLKILRSNGGDLDAKINGYSIRERRAALFCQATLTIKPPDEKYGPFAFRDGQIMAALSASENAAIQMKTGEGKTGVVAMAAFINSGYGEPVHIITNDLVLASQGRNEFSMVFDGLGVSNANMEGKDASGKPIDTDDIKRQKYSCEILYTDMGTIAFDILHDVQYPSQVFNTAGYGKAIVDESDACVIDSGNNPFIISQNQASSQSANEQSLKAAMIVAEKFNACRKELTGGTIEEMREKIRGTLGSDVKTVDKLAGFSASGEPYITKAGARIIEAEFRKAGAPIDLSQVKKIGDRIRMSDVDAAFKDTEKSHMQNVQLGRIRSVFNAMVVANEFRQGENYQVVDGKVQLIGGGDGRLAVGTELGNGVHQAIEARAFYKYENGKLTLRDPSKKATFSEQKANAFSITVPEVMQCYTEGFSGLSGTNGQFKKEFAKNPYKLDYVEIPRHAGEHLTQLPDVFVQCRWGYHDDGTPNEKETWPEFEKRAKNAKFKEIAESVDRITNMPDSKGNPALGRPILLGCESDAEAKELTNYLVNYFAGKGDGAAANRISKISSTVAPKAEKAFLAKAGELGAITVATIIAGRGTDIKMSKDAVKAGGLHALGASHFDGSHKDAQFEGRTCRNGEPGSSQFFNSPADIINRDVIKKAGPRALDRLSNVVTELQSMQAWRIMDDAFTSGSKGRDVAAEMDALKALRTTDGVLESDGKDHKKILKGLHQKHRTAENHTKNMHYQSAQSAKSNRKSVRNQNEALGKMRIVYSQKLKALQAAAKSKGFSDEQVDAISARFRNKYDKMVASMQEGEQRRIKSKSAGRSQMMRKIARVTGIASMGLLAATIIAPGAVAAIPIVGATLVAGPLAGIPLAAGISKALSIASLSSMVANDIIKEVIRPDQNKPLSKVMNAIQKVAPIIQASTMLFSGASAFRLISLATHASNVGAEKLSNQEISLTIKGQRKKVSKELDEIIREENLMQEHEISQMNRSITNMTKRKVGLNQGIAVPGFVQNMKNSLSEKLNQLKGEGKTNNMTIPTQAKGIG